MIARSLAKINLFLSVLGKREDGYHELCTLMHKIDFFDYIEITKIHSNRIDLITNADEIENEENLSYKAAVLFFKNTGIKPQVKIDIEKHIPLGAGLGGGSSNAAYTLKVLNELFDFPLNDSQMHNIACRLGCDVPFFLCKKPAALARGRGEVLKEIDCDLKNHSVFLAIPNMHISTACIYSKLLLTSCGCINKMPVVSGSSAECNIENVKLSCCNDLESVVLKEFGKIKDLKFLLHRYFGNALLSGSGASVFSIINPEVKRGEEVERLLESEGLFCKTVNFAEEGR